MKINIPDLPPGVHLYRCEGRAPANAASLAEAAEAQRIARKPEESWTEVERAHLLAVEKSVDAICHDTHSGPGLTRCPRELPVEGPNAPSAIELCGAAVWELLPEDRVLLALKAAGLNVSERLNDEILNAPRIT